MEKRLPLAVGTILQGRYRIVRQLGHGGFGAVYEAADDELGLSFALKETFYASDEDLRQAFRREARMLASLSHEAFPRVTHYFTEGDGCFLVMELVQGDDLDKLLSKRAAPFEQEQILTWADQILDALEDLHSSGIIHRDIKPANLKLTPKGKIKLLDFGIAKGMLEGETELMTTVGSMAAATLQYAPLEQVLKASPQYQMMLSVVSSDKVMEVMLHGTDASSDLYALAATLYQLLTKKLPADAPTRALAIWSGQNDRLIPAHEVNPQISRKVSDVLQKALQIDRFERLSSAAAMRRQLSEAVKQTAPNNFTPPDTIKVTENFVPPTMPQNPAPFFAEPVKREQQGEVTKWRELPKSAEKPKSSFAFYAVVIGLPLLLLIFGSIGLAVYLNLPSMNTNSKTASKYEFIQTLVAHKNAVTTLSYSADGKVLASSGSPNEVQIWDMTTNSLKRGVSFADSAAMSPDGKYLAYAVTDSGKSGLGIFLVNGSTSTTIIMPSADTRYDSIKFSPDGNFVYYVQLDSQTNSYAPYKIPILGGAPTKIQTPSRGVGAIFSPDLKSVAVVVAGSFVISDAADGSVKRILSGYSGLLNSSAFSPDGKTFAGGGQSDICIWEVAKEDPKQMLKGHTNNVRAIAFSPDGKLIASGGFDQTIKIWNAASGSLLQTLTGHSNTVNTIIFSPDGKTIASGSEDKTIRLWRVK